MKSFKLIIMAAMLLIGTNAQAQNAFPISDITTKGGNTVEFSIGMDNNVTAITFQFDLYLPEGVTIEEDSYGDPVATISSRASDHLLFVARQSDGAYRFLSYSNRNRAYSGNTGEIATAKLHVNAEAGEYEIKIKNAYLTQAETFQEIPCSETSCKLIVGGSGSISLSVVAMPRIRMAIGDKLTFAASMGASALTNVTWSTDDATVATVAAGEVTALKEGTTVLRVTNGLSNGECELVVYDPNSSGGIKGDVNKDGAVDIADVNSVINIILGK